MLKLTKSFLQEQKINRELETNLIVKYWLKNFIKSFSNKTKICSSLSYNFAANCLYSK